MDTKTISIIVLIILIAGGGWWLFKDVPADDAMMEGNMDGEDAMMEKEGDAMADEGSMMEKDEGAMMDKGDGAMEGEAMMQKGSYETYAPEKLAKAQDGDVVLFFRASWCPTCRALDANIRSNLEAIPAGVTILDVDYDNSTALKQKYGVTYQHTLVQVDAQGNMITKWMGSPVLSDLLAKIK